MAKYLASQGYRSLQELKDAIQYSVGPLEYLTFKDDVANGTYTAPRGENAQASGYTLNPENYETKEDYYGDIITMIALNPDKRTEILQANGYQYLADVKNDMQESGPSAYLDLKGRIEAMGYEMPKVGTRRRKYSHCGPIGRICARYGDAYGKDIACRTWPCTHEYAGEWPDAFDKSGYANVGSGNKLNPTLGQSLTKNDVVNRSAANSTNNAENRCGLCKSQRLR